MGHRLLTLYAQTIQAQDGLQLSQGLLPHGAHPAELPEVVSYEGVGLTPQLVVVKGVGKLEDAGADGQVQTAD